MGLLERLPDPHLFDDIPKQEAELFAIYLFRFPKDPDKVATLKPITKNYSACSHDEKYRCD